MKFSRALVFVALLMIVGLYALAQQSANIPEIAPGFALPQMKQVAPTVFVKEFAPGLWLYTVVGKLSNGDPYPANGVLLVHGSSSVLIDSGWEPAHTEALLGFAKETLKRPITRAVITHSHEDRSAGIQVLEHAGVEVIGFERTTKILAAQGKAVPNHVLAQRDIPYKGEEGFEVYYPGPGHTEDNLVVYFPQQKLIFGGCFLKSSNSKNLGNVADANLAQWPVSLKNVEERYPEAKFVVPGHGPMEGDSIGTTRSLLLAKPTN